MFFPASFTSNTFDRMILFLNESNRIEGITEIDYGNKEFQQAEKGHFGALILSQKGAEEHKNLTVRDIKSWQKLLTEEQEKFGHHIDKEAIGVIRGPNLQRNVRIANHIPPSWELVPTQLDYLLEQINEQLKDQEKLRDDAAYCQFLGKSFQKFESIHPFADGNGRTGRLLANYIATYCSRPIIVFNSERVERNRYYEAHQTAKKMIRFMANKIQEVIFGINHSILFKTTSYSGKIQYINENEQKDYDWRSLDSILNDKDSEISSPHQNKD